VRGGDAEQGGRLALAAAKSTGQVQIGVLDVLAARRRRLPMVKFDNTRYVFDTSAGPKALLDLFAGHRQLVVYQFMDNGPDDCCPGCTHFTSSVVDLVSWSGPASAGRQCPTCRSPRSRPTRHGWAGSVPFALSHGTTFADDCTSALPLRARHERDRRCTGGIHLPEASRSRAPRSEAGLLRRSRWPADSGHRRLGRPQRERIFQRPRGICRASQCRRARR